MSKFVARIDISFQPATFNFFSLHPLMDPRYSNTQFDWAALVGIRQSLRENLNLLLLLLGMLLDFRKA